jgi:hypothetical protein
MTVAKLLKWDFSKGYLNLYDKSGNRVYLELDCGAWCRYEYDEDGNETYYENSFGEIKRKNRSSCDGKTVEIDGKKYKLTEVK